MTEFFAETLKVRLTMTEPLLGTASANPELHAEFIASKAPDAPSREEEVAALGVEEAIDKAMTVFPRNASGTPIYWDYQVKGFFKETASACRKIPALKTSKLTAFKKAIDTMIFIYPRQIEIKFEGVIGNLQRPLRAQTAQGERIALANSEMIPAGAQLEFTVKVMDKAHMAMVREWLDYGEIKGMGQWRNSSYGRFTWEEIKE